MKTATVAPPAGAWIEAASLSVICLLLAGNAPAGDSPAGPPPKEPAAARILRLPQVPYSYGRDDLPAHFRTPAARAFDNTPATNPITDRGATLGRALFYDTRLSSNSSVSCGSCHRQAHAFADPRRFTTGHEGAATDRNGMSLVNLRFTKPGFFWDIRAATLEDQVLVPIRSRVEMGRRTGDLADAIGRDGRYPPLFRGAFGDPEVTSSRVARALAQFVRSMVSYRSKYDAGLARVESAEDDFPNFTADENLGKAVFGEKCAICHAEGRGSQSAYFSMFTALNNGIDRTGSEPDAGRGDMTLIPSDVGLFKPSDLRNVEHTAPYMHDGRFQTLEEVIEHYSVGVNRHPNASGFIFRMHFTGREEKALVAFLKTLSDEAFLNDPRFSDPWGGGAAVAAKPARTAPEPEGAATAGGRPGRSSSRRAAPAGETAARLRSLDADGDGALSREETAPLAGRLAKDGGPPRFDRRRFAPGSLRIGRGAEAPPAIMAYDRDGDQQLGPDELPEPRRHLIGIGDLDSDGKIGLEEARGIEAIERFVALQANDRDRSRVERMVRAMKLPEAGAGDLIGSLRRAKEAHERRMAEQDAALVAKLEAAMGREQYARFQDLMLAKQDDRALTREGGEAAVAAMQARIFEFDKDRDGLLNSGEREALAKVLDETPGGFGTPLGSRPTTRQFADRMMARDRDRDGLVSAAELPERMLPVLMPADADRSGTLGLQELDHHLRTAGFKSLVAEGIYAGGGFANAFSGSSRLIAELELPPDVANEAAALLDARERQIREAVAEATASVARIMREARPAREDHPRAARPARKNKKPTETP